MFSLLALLFGGVATVFPNPSGSWRLNCDLSEAAPYGEIGFPAPPELLLPLDNIVLSVTDTLATFYGDDGKKRKYVLSGAQEHSVFRGFEVYTRSRWDGLTLRLEVMPHASLVVTENYTRVPRSNQLLLAVIVWREGRRVGPPTRYVYDSVLSSAATKPEFNESAVAIRLGRARLGHVPA
jgi:hypothetical protein